ncbi:hypothetical protein JNO12_01380 [Erwinia aphidicola]|nr:hypothetical protein [Erwinia aphidicola]
MNFSRAYFTSAFVMVVRQQADSPRNLSDMDNKKSGSDQRHPH